MRHAGVRTSRATAAAVGPGASGKAGRAGEGGEAGGGVGYKLDEDRNCPEAK